MYFDDVHFSSLPSIFQVKNPEKYSFNPRMLLSTIIDIYLNLRQTDFIKAIAQESRSYRAEHFYKAIRILRKFGLKPENELAQLEKFVEHVEQARQLERDRELELGPVPEEFLDPIVFSIMEDPVILPTSSVTVDRKTIVSHLLSDHTDPFNRQKLTTDMLIPSKYLRFFVTTMFMYDMLQVCLQFLPIPFFYH
jgi:ubiquitin conjugation factor E4 B